MVYSSKFHLNVVDLTRIDLATDEDKIYQIDYWARLFTATDWEEMIMIAENNPALSEAAQTIYEMNADEYEKAKCRARHDYYKMKNIADAHLRKVTDERDTLAAKNSALTDENAALSDEIKQLKARLAEFEKKHK